MKEKVEQRLKSLRSEFEEGQKILAELEAKQVNLRETLLRISGAIQILEEMLNETSEGDSFSSDMPDSGSEAIVSPQQTDVLT